MARSDWRWNANPSEAWQSAHWERTDGAYVVRSSHTQEKWIGWLSGDVASMSPPSPRAYGKSADEVMEAMDRDYPMEKTNVE